MSGLGNEEGVKREGRQTHFKVGIDVLGDNVLGFGFVLTIDDVHVQLALGALEQRPQLAHVLAALFNGLQEDAAKDKSSSSSCRSNLVIVLALGGKKKTTGKKKQKTNVLVVPVVDGLDVAENDLVFAFSEIVRDGWRQAARIADVGRLPSIDSQTHQRHVTIDDLAQITDVVPLRLYQLLVSRNEANNTRRIKFHAQENRKRKSNGSRQILFTT